MCTYFSTYEAQGSIGGFDDHMLNMRVPTEIADNFKSEVFGMIHLLEDLAVQHTGVFNWIS